MRRRLWRVKGREGWGAERLGGMEGVPQEQGWVGGVGRQTEVALSLGENEELADFYRHLEGGFWRNPFMKFIVETDH